MTTSGFELNKKKKVDLVKLIQKLERDADGSRTTTDTERRETQAHQEEVVAATDGLSPESIIQDIGALQLKLNNDLGAVSDQLVNRTRQLQQVSEAITIKGTELDNLHDKEAVLQGIEQLVLDYGEKERTFTTAQETARTEWVREQELHDRSTEERDNELARTRSQDQVDFDYKMRQAKWEVEEKFSDTLRKRNFDEAKRQDDLQRNWDNREQFLADAEGELGGLRTRVEHIDTEVAERVQTEVATETGKVHGTYKHQIAMLNRQAETDVQIRDAQITSLSGQLTATQAEIVDLKATVSSANEKVESMAKAAFTEAGTSRVVAEMQRFQESRNNGQPQRGSRS